MFSLINKERNVLEISEIFFFSMPTEQILICFQGSEWGFIQKMYGESKGLQLNISEFTV